MNNFNEICRTGNHMTEPEQEIKEYCPGCGQALSAEEVEKGICYYCFANDL